MTLRDTPAASQDLPRKVIVGVALIALAVGALKLGGVAFWILVAVGTLLMLAEWGGLVDATQGERKIAMFAATVPLAILSPWAAGPSAFALGLIFGAAFFTVIITRHAKLAAGIVYVGLPAIALLYIRNQPDGLVYAFWALALVWATDIGAYFTGRNLGGPKLAPKLSPNKTWSGLIGGMIAALLTGLAFSHWAELPMILAISSFILAAVAQGGDLFESALKRRAGVKDSGAILPGHGGVLDRLDGVVPVAPIVALVIFAGTAL